MKSPASTLGVELDRATRIERRRALETLLMQPLLTAEGFHGDKLALVRRHAEWLRRWLSHYPGWTLQLERGLARLRKTPANLRDGTRPALDVKTKEPFSRRRYVLLCLALAVLERCERQITLGELAHTLVEYTQGDPVLAETGFHFHLETRSQRRDLVQVVRFLITYEVLVKVDGDEWQYEQGRGDALYTVRRPVLAALLDVRHSPSTIEASTLEDRLTALVDEPVPDSAEGRNRRLRSFFFRRLLDDPVVYAEDLDDEQLAYYQSQRPHLVREIHEATGLLPEVRREGLAMVTERKDFTDSGLPEEGTRGHLTLLLAQHLSEHARHHPGEPLGLAALETHTADLVERYRKYWAKWATEPGAESRILNETLDRLAALRLVARGPGGVLPLPAIGRFSLEEPNLDSTRSPSP